MRRPVLVPGAIFSPGHCMICGSNEGAMIDTCVDIPGDGRMYVCVRICAPLIAQLIGEYPEEAICSALKTNGQPCTAKALPGYELCVAHVKTRRQKEETHELVAADVQG